MKLASQMLLQSFSSSVWKYFFPSRSESICLREDSPQTSQRITKSATVPTACNWSHLVSFSDQLVSSCGGPTKQTLFWRENTSSWSSTALKATSEYLPSCLHSSTFSVKGEQRTFLITASWEGSLSVWNEVGEIICEEEDAHNNCILAICCWDNFIATADFNGVLKIWKLREEPAGIKIDLQISKKINCGKIHSLLSVADGDSHKIVVAGDRVSVWDSQLQSNRVLEGCSTLFTRLCRFKQWIVGGSLEGNVYLWNLLDNRLDKKLEVGEYIFSVQAWADFLCIGLRNKLILWEPTENSVKSLEGSHTMTVHKDTLVTCKGTELIFYHSRTGWNSLKVLWAGYLKEESEECNLSMLPPEMFRTILSYL